MTDQLPPFSFCHSPEQPRRKSQNLNFADGYPEVRDPEKRKKERMALLENMKDYNYEGGACGDCNINTDTPTPKWLKYDRQVLRFFCYFKEPVNERREENFRVRRCTIYFYLEDGSMHISEPREDNSGIVQGTFLKRHKVPKHGGGYIGISNFKVGSDITVYERTFRICSCDTFTKRYFMKRCYEIGKEEDFPDGPVSSFRETLQRHRLKHHKDFANRQFLENDGKVLRFFAVWDDRFSVYGDRHPYVLHYFLADDTIEILEINERNSGRHNFPMLLKRNRLPRELPSDLLGFMVEICFYMTVMNSQGIIIKKNGELLMTCWSQLMSRNLHQYCQEWKCLPIMALARTLIQCKIVLCFSSRMAEDETHKVSPPDRGRLFVFKFFLSDDTISIYEPPTRNSGIVSGKFLSREAAPKKPCTNKRYQPSDMIVGAKLVIHDRLFELLQADEWTLKYMETHPDEFPLSDYENVVKKVESFLSKMPEDGLHHLKMNLPTTANDPTGKLTAIDQLSPLLTRAGLKLTKQELVTLDRHASKGQEKDVPDIQTLFFKIVSKSMKSSVWGANKGLASLPPQ
ncbi:hypothetical protein O6H91_23G065400 [Diphasiastrum complanatum]|uniref:Uncharacterized protein n=1 Tax=Diphasiastrum complanatum TaxID=34168 RepID=A0ACC2ABP1_DIPCM|nr:hypothetical protein O6H91_23G065400 [Diphasiastrum complanatum]